MSESKKIFIIGDSVLKGVMYSEEAERYKLYENCAYGDLASKGYSVENLCRMGATISAGKKLLERAISEADKDSAIILSFGGNDSDYSWSEVSKNPDAEHLPHTPPEKFIAEYGECVEAAKATGAKVLLTNLIPMYTERFMKWISRGLVYENILKWLGDIGVIYRKQELYSMMAEEIAEKYKCPVIDIRSAFLRSFEFPKLICADGIHPTRDGHEIIHRVIRENI